MVMTNPLLSLEATPASQSRASKFTSVRKPGDSSTPSSRKYSSSLGVVGGARTSRNSPALQSTRTSLSPSRVISTTWTGKASTSSLEKKTPSRGSRAPRSSTHSTEPQESPRFRLWTALMAGLLSTITYLTSFPRRASSSRTSLARWAWPAPISTNTPPPRISSISTNCLARALPKRGPRELEVK